MTKFTGEKTLMRIFIGEGDRYEGRPLYQGLVDLFRKEGCAGATVLRGVAGFGGHSTYHTDRIIRLSSDLPLVVEVVEDQEKLDLLMPTIDEMMNGGMITMEKATVIRYSHRNDD